MNITNQSPDVLNNIMVSVFPLVIAASVALYKIVVQYLPAAKHAQLQSLVSNLGHIATQAVQATEQFMGSEAGPIKKAAASNDIAAILNAAGIRGVPPELIDHAVEAAVYSMNLFDKPASAPPAVAAIPSVVPNRLVGVMNAGSTALQSMSEAQNVTIPGNLSGIPNVANTSATATPTMMQNTPIL